MKINAGSTDSHFIRGFRRLNSQWMKTILTCFAIVLYVGGICISLNALIAGKPAYAATEKKPMSLQDIMKFKALRGASISDKGDFVVYFAQPGRGNPEAIVSCVNGTINGKKSISIPRGIAPSITKDSRWVAATILPDALEMEKSDQKDKLKTGMALLETSTGKITNFERVKSFTFSRDSKWLCYQIFPEEKKAEEKKPEEKKSEEKKEVKAPESKPGEKKPEAKEEKKEEKKKDAPTEEEEKIETSPLILRELGTGKEIRIENVSDFSVDPASRFIVYVTVDKEKKMNACCVRDLTSGGNTEKKLNEGEGTKYNLLTWSKKNSRLGFIFQEKKHEKQPEIKAETKAEEKDYQCELWVWDGIKNKLTRAVGKERQPQGWIIPNESRLVWTDDEARLYVGLKPEDEYLWQHPKKDKPIDKDKIDLFSEEQLLGKRGVDVWHWQDPIINSQQKIGWEMYKAKVYWSVYHFNEDKFVHLTTQDVPSMEVPENGEYAVGLSDRPYRIESTWAGSYADVYTVNLKNGAKQKILTHTPYEAMISFNGKYVLYFKDNHWFLHNIRTNTARNLTANIPVSFTDEDNDKPADPSTYGVAGWTENDASVLIYDKFDIWEFPTDGSPASCVTGGEGRKNKMVFRIETLDPEQKFFKKGQVLLLDSYSDEEKYTAFYSAEIGKKGVNKLISVSDKKYRFLKKAKEADKLLFSRENLEEFPDVWVSEMNFKTPAKVSDVNPEMANYLWGKAELVDWQGLDGQKLQGVVIKPENYDKNKRYPVVVYFYELSSDRLCEFNEVVINHRPCFPYYAGNGYVMFLPDIKFEIGRPGLSALKCLVPGVQKLVSMGIADPNAVALLGHSWSGYLAAYLVTQTNMFKAAIAGAAVFNMTSAYSGIRLESGIARQAQYEKEQSRLGQSLFDAPELYIQNSPVFFANRINTPVLVEFGDKDGAVPWYQGIEFYLALRRLNKNCIFLQYNDEGHHHQKYPNKLDYTIKMKEFLDHHLKGAPAPEWMTKGVPYQKK